MIRFSKKQRFYILSFQKHDFKASISVFFVALPLCLGVALASNAPVYSGLIAGIIGGIVIGLISKSSLSVSGPAAGLTAICAAAITKMGAIEIFFLSVSIGGLLQLLLGIFKLGGFTHLIPSSVIKGMLAAIGLILISKQVPLLIGYDKPDFWREEFVNLLTFQHGFKQITNLYESISIGAILIGLLCLFLLVFWEKYLSKRMKAIPVSFILVLFASLLALFFKKFLPSLALTDTQYVNVPHNVLQTIRLPDFSSLFSNSEIWKNAVVICFVATLETLLSIEAIDKIDPYNRITPQNRELIAQGTGNILSGLVGGLPITAVIVRSSANAEAGAKTKLSAITHGIWIVIALIIAIPFLNMIPYAVLAVILIRTGFGLTKPAMIMGVYRQGREQFMPFIITVVAILFTDLLIGVLIGIGYAVYFLVKHTYRAGFTMNEKQDGHIRHYHIDLALNVSFLNKKKLRDTLDSIPEYSIIDIFGSRSVYIDHDILEIIQDYKVKAKNKHIELHLSDIPEVETIELH
jgi:MFS superfamily sulfate permease-like transporter